MEEKLYFAADRKAGWWCGCKQSMWGGGRGRGGAESRTKEQHSDSFPFLNTFTEMVFLILSLPIHLFIYLMVDSSQMRI